MPVVYTGGTFDLPHRGHVKFLETCKKIAGEGGIVVVSLNTDEFIMEYKKKPPIMSFEERKAILEEFRSVDLVIPNIGGADSKPAITAIMPSFIAIGSDWAKKDYYKQMDFTQEWLDHNGITLVYIPYTEGVSTTEIKRRINEA